MGQRQREISMKRSMGSRHELAPPRDDQRRGGSTRRRSRRSTPPLLGTTGSALVLETLFHEHDVELAIPFLIGQSNTKRTGRLVEHLKRLFVAATRPIGAAVLRRARGPHQRRASEGIHRCRLES